ncbi:MAG: hypothetical protein ABI353_04255 [Isosphaeraceae bacterium]
MNLAFPALIIFVLVLPGLIFRRTYLRGSWNYPIGRLGPVSEQVFHSVIYAAILNVVWATAIQVGFRGQIHIEHVVHLLTNSTPTAKTAGADPRRPVRGPATPAESISSYPLQIAAYFFGLYVLAWVVGLALHTLVRSKKWDRSCLFSVPLPGDERQETRWYGIQLARYFRFENEWHYLLTGESLQFFEYRGRTTFEEREGTLIAAAVETKDHSYLYIGVLADYSFDPTGNLDKLVITDAVRRKLTDDDASDYYPIKGYYLVLKMSEIKTLNIDYLTRADRLSVENYLAGLNPEHANETPDEFRTERELFD